MRIKWDDTTYILNIGGTNYQFEKGQEYTIDDPDTIKWMSDKQYINLDEDEDTLVGVEPERIEPPGVEIVDPERLDESEDSVIEE